MDITIVTLVEAGFFCPQRRLARRKRAPAPIRQDAFRACRDTYIYLGRSMGYLDLGHVSTARSLRWADRPRLTASEPEARGLAQEREPREFRLFAILCRLSARLQGKRTDAWASSDGYAYGAKTGLRYEGKAGLTKRPRQAKFAICSRVTEELGVETWRSQESRRPRMNDLRNRSLSKATLGFDAPPPPHRA